LSVIRTGVPAHDLALQAAEAAKQQTIVPGASAATIRSAELTYYRACVASCRANNNSAGIEQFTTALKEMTGSTT
jgi:hypothetical protein